MNICEINKQLFERLLVVAPRFLINGVEQTVYALEEKDLAQLASDKALTSSFVPSARIAEGWKYLYTDNDVAYEAQVLFKWHSPDSGAGENSVSQHTYTAQISITADDKVTGVTSTKYLCADYARARVEWVRNARQKWTHIPVIRNLPQPPGGDDAILHQSPSGGESSRKETAGLYDDNSITRRKEVVSMTVNFNDLLRKANAYNEGESSEKCNEVELQALFTEFRALANKTKLSDVEVARFEQIVTIIFCFEEAKGIEKIELISDDAREIFEDVQNDFTED